MFSLLTFIKCAFESLRLWGPCNGGVFYIIVPFSSASSLGPIDSRFTSLCCVSHFYSSFNIFDLSLSLISSNACLRIFNSVLIVMIQCASASWWIFSENFHPLIRVDSCFLYSYNNGACVWATFSVPIHLVGRVASLRVCDFVCLSPVVQFASWLMNCGGWLVSPWPETSVMGHVGSGTGPTGQ